MSFEKNSFKVVKKRRLQKSEFNVECNVPVEGEINKIFSVCHTVMVENVEVSTGVASYNGNIDFCILYESANGEIVTNNYTCPFTSKLEDEKLVVGDKVQVSVDVVDFSIDSATSSNVKINCLLVQRGVVISCYNVDTIDANDNDICTKKEEIYISTFIGEASEVFTNSSEVSIKEPVKKVLLCDASVSIKNVECGNNFVAVTGEVIGRLLYLTENDRYETSYISEIYKFIKENRLGNRVHFIHDMALSDLPVIYRMSKAFVFPSRYEGFGIPIIEALTSGVPVVAATGSCLEEAGGPASLYVSPDDVEGMAKALQKILSDSSLRAEMINYGREYVSRFDSSLMASALLETYGRVMEMKKRNRK